ncbi:MAG: pitrilysin family protein [Pseudomonadota bacterium]
MSDGCRTTRLGNGIRIVTQRMARLQTASVGIWADVGARYEAAPENGVAHFLEHMAFKGTVRRSARAIAEEIEAVGGQLNAYTSREHTAYYARVLAADVPLAVDLLADIVRHSVFDEAEIDRERTVILQEIGQVQDTPDDLVFDLFQERAFPDQPLGRSILGPADVVARLGRGELRRYLDQHYAADRLVVAAAGAVDHDALVALVDAALGDLPPRDREALPGATYVGGRHLQDDDLEQVHVVLGWQGVPFTDPDFYAAQVLTTALGGGMSSRLFQEIREKRGLAYSVFAFSSSYIDCGLVGTYAATSATDAPAVAALLDAETRALVGAPTETEIARARSQLKASLLMSLESCSAVCEDLARQHLIFGDYLSPGEVVARIDRVSPDVVAALGRRILDAGAATLTAIGPAVGNMESVAADVAAG